MFTVYFRVGARHWQKKTASAGGFFGYVLIQSSVERSPLTAKGNWPKIVGKAVAAG
jgi:hypothetical protein